MRALLATLALAALAVATPAWAAPAKGDAVKRAAALDALSACRREADAGQRLACFDKAAGALDEAEAKGQVVVMDREQVRTVKREAFGLSLPNFNLFASRGGTEERVDRVTYTLDHAGHLPDGKWLFATTDGAVWVQTDITEELRGEPHKGSQMAVRHAALSSFFCNVDGQRAVRCQRQH